MRNFTFDVIVAAVVRIILTVATFITGTALMVFGAYCFTFGLIGIDIDVRFVNPWMVCFGIVLYGAGFLINGRLITWKS